ncbi:MAG: phosphoribosyltransferase family protein [Rhodobacteraceae bacterium]|nr:phosphoribosyltransferase family protein [Paracoccaceae bacterium]
MFADRTEAGRALADRLAGMDLADPVIFALPRGGVPVALPVADRLNAPLDLLLVRKLGAPGQPELAVGAVVEGAEPVINASVLRAFGLAPGDLAAQVDAKRAEIAARRALWLAGRDPVPVAGRTAVVVDDGIATGATMRAALRGLAARGPARVILAVPVAPAEVIADLAPLVDRAVCLDTPDPFYAVGAHYRVFDQVADDAVARMLSGQSRGG